MVTLTTADALLRGVLENPADDGARLALAEALTEPVGGALGKRRQGRRP